MGLSEECRGHCLLLLPGQSSRWEEQINNVRSNSGVRLEVINFSDGNLPSFGFGSGTFDVIFAASGTSRYDGIYATILEALKPGGTFILHEAVGEAPLRSMSELTMSLTFAGLMETQGTPLPVERVLEMKAKKPDWGVGASASISNKSRAAAAPAKAGTTWKFMSDDMDDDTALIDEDDLLEDDVVIKKPEDCAPTGKPGKKRACANCSCGLREMQDGEERPAVSDDQLKKMVSDCGSCSKGDAFRCANCPHLGKPAFKPGEEHLVLDLNDDA